MSKNAKRISYRFIFLKPEDAEKFLEEVSCYDSVILAQHPLTGEKAGDLSKMQALVTVEAIGNPMSDALLRDRIEKQAEKFGGLKCPKLD